jgi:hypothetical protein
MNCLKRISLVVLRREMLLMLSYRGHCIVDDYDYDYYYW